MIVLWEEFGFKYLIGKKGALIYYVTYFFSIPYFAGVLLHSLLKGVIKKT